MRCALIILLIFQLFGCVPPKQASTQEVVMYANLKNEAEAIRQYDQYHAKEGVWPEVGLAAQQSGILSVKMYRFQNQLIMILTVPQGANMDEVNRKYAASSEKIGEWGKLMAGLFEPLKVEGQEMIWVEMKKVHHYEDGHFK